LRLAPRELEISLDEGFTPEKDIFNRAPFGETLTRLVCALEGPAVALLDAQWGAGKTTFVKMWAGELAKIGVPTIYFDAFANDYHDDAFLTVAREIVARAEQLQPRSKKTLRKFKDSAIGVAKALGRASVRIGIRTASSGLLTGDELIEGVKIASDGAKAVGDEAAKAIDDLLRERLESQKADREIFDQFRAGLGELAKTLSGYADGAKPAEPNCRADEGRASPLVFIIDELDRCRPSFALELLEKTKHFFAVPGVIFLLVASRSQLETVVRFAYGDIDVRTYLEKFYHLRLLFPVGTSDRPDMAMGKYLGHLRREYSVANTSASQIIERFSRVRTLSLRTLERIFAYVTVSEVSISPRHFNIFYIVAALCIMKVLDAELYETCRTGNATFAAVNELMKFSCWHDLHNPLTRDRMGEDAETWWRYALGDLQNEELVHQCEHSLAPFSHSHPSMIVPHFCEIIDGFSLPGAP
jgi:KAP family P-loop domain